MNFHFNFRYLLQHSMQRRSHFSRDWNMLQPRFTAVLAVVLGLSSTAQAHSLSTSYGQLETKTAQMTGPVLQLQLALSDLH
jgi:hypothetical protein